MVKAWPSTGNAHRNKDCKNAADADLCESLLEPPYREDANAHRKASATNAQHEHEV